jgi:DNA-binding NarL/FixJ family response regulator
LILIADDETSFRESTAELLRDQGHRCICVADASAALLILQRNDVDVVIADIRMPGNTQLELLKQIRDLGCDAPIILVTGYPTVGSAVNSLNLGVSGYLVKPFELDQLLELLDRSMEAMRSIRRLRSTASELNRLASDAENLAAGKSGPAQGDPRASTRAAFDLAVESVIELLADLRGNAPPAAPEAPEVTPLPEISRISESIPGLAALTPREDEVLLMLLSGDRVPSIARDLHISPNTVRNHLKSIFRKLNVGSQVELLDRLKEARSA